MKILKYTDIISIIDIKRDLLAVTKLAITELAVTELAITELTFAELVSSHGLLIHPVETQAY